MPIDKNTLIQAGAHHGHLARKWSPDFRPYLLMKHNKRHIINLDHTIKCLEQAGEAMKELVATGKKILFIGRKKQAKTILQEAAKRLQQPFVTEKRWLGGTATNFETIKKLLKKLLYIERQQQDPTYLHLTKKEKLIANRKKRKLEILLQGMITLKRLPAAFFVVDVVKEWTAVKEAHKLGIPIFAILDSNAPSHYITYPIPANDDAISSIKVIVDHLASKIEEGLAQWELEKEQRKQQRHATTTPKTQTNPVNPTAHKPQTQTPSTSTANPSQPAATPPISQGTNTDKATSTKDPNTAPKKSPSKPTQAKKATTTSKATNPKQNEQPTPSTEQATTTPPQKTTAKKTPTNDDKKTNQTPPSNKE